MSGVSHWACEVVGTGTVSGKGVKWYWVYYPRREYKEWKGERNQSRLLQNFPLCMDTNLVDPASSHTLVSKIKPCMCKCKFESLELRMAHYISYSLFGEVYYLDNRSNSRANT